MYNSGIGTSPSGPFAVAPNISGVRGAAVWRISRTELRGCGRRVAPVVCSARSESVGRRSRALLLASSALVAIGAQTAHAADTTWTNGNATDVWSDNGNWDTAAKPTVGDNALITQAGTSGTPVALNSVEAADNVTISNGNRVNATTGGALSVGGATNVSSAGLTVALSVSGGATVSTGSLAVSGSALVAVSGGSTVTSLGTTNIGTSGVLSNLVLTGGGIFNAGAGGANDITLGGAGATGTISIGNSSAAGTLNAANVLGSGSVNLNQNDAGAVTFASNIGGSVSITHGSAGTPGVTPITLMTGNNTSTGGVLINRGTMRAGGNNVFSANGQYQVEAPATLDLNGNNQQIGSLTGAGSVSLGTATLIAGGNNATTTFSGVISGDGGLVKTGAGTMTLSGVNTYTGTTTVSGGTLALGVANALSNATAVTVDTTLNVNGFNQEIGSLAGSGNVNLGAAAFTTGTNNASTIFSGVIADGGSLIKSGTGTMTLTGANTYTGGTTINTGILQIGNGGATGSIAGDVANNATLAFNRSDTLTLGGVISGAGALQQNGTGTLVLTGANTYTGTTTINSGTLQLGNGGTTGSIAGNVTNNANLAFNRSNAVTFGGVISGIGAVQHNGGGTTTLTGANSYTGGTTINAGTLQLGAGGSLAAGSALTVNAGGTFDLNGQTQTVGSLAGAGNIALGGNFTAGTLTVASSNDLTFGGAITGGGVFGELGVGLRKAGTGTLTLTGSNTFLRATHVEAGTLRAGAAGTFSILSRVNVSAGATLDLNSFNQSITALTGAGNVTLGSATLTLGSGQLTGQGTFFSGTISGSGGVNLSGFNNAMPVFIFDGANTYTGGTTIATGTTLQLGIGGTSGSIVGDVLNNGTLTFNRSDAVTFGGVISGTGGVQKNGGGALTLTGTNSYTGATALNQGGLIVNGSIASSSALTVNNNTFVGGTGTLPTTTVNAGGMLAPGNSIGTISVNGNLTFNAGSTYFVEVSPTEADRTNVTGTASLAGTVAAVFLPGSYIQRSYTLIAAAARNGTFDALATGGLPAGFTAAMNYTSTEAQLVLTAVLGNTPPTGPNPLPPGGTLPQNQKNVAAALNNFFNSGGTLPPDFVALFGLTGPSLVNALNQVSGQGSSGASPAAVQMMNGFLSLMLNPYGGAPDNNPGALGYARAFGAADRSPLPQDAADAYAAIMPVKAAPASSFGQRWSVWGQGFGGYNETDGDTATGSADTTARTYGFAAGADYRLAANTTIGFALAGGEFNWRLAQGLGGGKSDVFQAGAYGSHRMGAAYVSAAVAGAWYGMRTDRTVSITGQDRLRGEFDASSVAARIEAGYRFATPFAGVTPYAAAQVQHVSLPGYAETAVSGANSFALAYGSRDETATRFELGAWFDRLIAMNGGNAVMLRGRAAWAHDEGNNAGIAAAFQALPGASFTVNGATPPKDLALVSAGSELRLRSGVSLAARFDGEFSGRAQTYAGSGTARYTW
jgi:autotransporter-associated beta strand protein